MLVYSYQVHDETGSHLGFLISNAVYYINVLRIISLQSYPH